MKPDGLIPGPGPWRLAPEGAVVHLRRRVAVVADVHLGYEWARGSGGDMIPPHSLAETREKLAGLLDRARIERLIVAGDLVESFAPCRRTARDVKWLREWLAGQGVELVTVRGNHDPCAGPASIEVAGWTIAHGHEPTAGARIIRGHLHPVLRAAGVVAPCFLVAADRIVLPAFTPNAAGFDVGRVSLSGPLRSASCVASVGPDLLDFGPVTTLAARLHDLRGRAPAAARGG
jgi:putative SbcD/Mre11-related phosphoesterase